MNFKLKFGGGNLFSPAMTSTIEGDPYSGLKNVMSDTGSSYTVAHFLSSPSRMPDRQSIGNNCKHHVNRAEGKLVSNCKFCEQPGLPPNLDRKTPPLYFEQQSNRFGTLQY
jgi:hypothetical protein